MRRLYSPAARSRLIRVLRFCLRMRRVKSGRAISRAGKRHAGLVEEGRRIRGRVIKGAIIRVREILASRRQEQWASSRGGDLSAVCASAKYIKSHLTLFRPLIGRYYSFGRAGRARFIVPPRDTSNWLIPLPSVQAEQETSAARCRLNRGYGYLSAEKRSRKRQALSSCI